MTKLVRFAAGYSDPRMRVRTIISADFASYERQLAHHIEDGWTVIEDGIAAYGINGRVATAFTVCKPLQNAAVVVEAVASPTLKDSNEPQ